MTNAKLYAIIEAKMIVARDSRMPASARNAWVSAQSNAAETLGSYEESAMFKAACFDALPLTASFEESKEARDWFESIGFTY